MHRPPHLFRSLLLSVACAVPAFATVTAVTAGKATAEAHAPTGTAIATAKAGSGQASGIGKPVARFCAVLDLFTARNCPAGAIAAAFKARSRKGTKFLDYIRNGDKEALLFARDETVFLLIRQPGLREIALPDILYREGDRIDSALPRLVAFSAVDDAKTRFVVLLQSLQYEGHVDSLFYVPAIPADSATLLVASSNVALEMARRGNNRVGIAAVWTNEGFKKSVEVAEAIPISAARCSTMAKLLKSTGSLGPVAHTDREWEEHTFGLEFSLARQPRVTKCSGSVKAKPMD